MSTTGLMNYFSDYTGTINERQRKWLLENLLLITSADSLNGLWMKYLRAQGYLGALPDMMYDWAGDESGNDAKSLPDRLNSLPFGGAFWSPAKLFTSGEQGVWYDPNDLSTLFQDSAGTTPVTAAGQPVGRMLDKSGRGNHATQPTAASRPIFSRHPTTGLRNQLTHTQELDNPAAGFWTRIGATVSVVGTAFKVVGNAAAVDSRISNAFKVSGSGSAHVSSVYAKADGAGYMHLSRSGEGVWFNLSTGAVHFARPGYTGFVSSPDVDGYRRYEVRFTETLGEASDRDVRIATSVSAPINSDPNSVGNDGVKGILVKKPQHERGSAASNYQLVVSASDVTEEGQDSVWYLRTDGIDDWMQTNPINFTATDKVTLFTGVRKLSDAVTAIIAELSVSTASNAGAFYMAAPPSSGLQGFGFAAKGTSQATATTSTHAAPYTAVVTGVGSIPAPSTTVRVNGAASVITSTLGTGNYGNYPLFLFRRAGTSLPFNGHFYGLTIVGRLCTAFEISSEEKRLAAATGVTLA